MWLPSFVDHRGGWFGGYLVLSDLTHGWSLGQQCPVATGKAAPTRGGLEVES